MQYLHLTALTLFVTSCTLLDTREISAIKGVTIIDAINGVRENQTVVFANDEILQILSSDDSSDYHRSIDGSGKYLIPGLWDFHVHLTYDVRLTRAMPELFLSYGVTSVRDTGGLMRNVLPVVGAMTREGAVSPRVHLLGHCSMETW